MKILAGHRVQLTLAGLMLVMFAGCLAPQPVEAPAPGPATSATQPTAMQFEMEGCDGNAAIFMVEPEQLWPHLSSSFEPRDAADLFSLPNPTGQGALLVAAMQCPEHGSTLSSDAHAYGFVAIFVETPAISHPDLEIGSENGQFDFFLTDFSVENAELMSKFGQWAWPVEAAEVVVANYVKPEGQDVYIGWGTAEVTVGANAAFQYRVITPIPLPRAQDNVGLDDFPLRLWVETALGVGTFAYKISHEFPVGGVESCSFAPGSTAAKVIGDVDCHVNAKEPNPPMQDADAQAPLGVLFTDFDAEGSIIWIPGDPA